jgi:hypothetical protein
MSFPCSWCRVHVCVHLCLHVLVHFHVKATWLSEDSQHLKGMGTRTADRSAACSDFIPTVYVHNMTWGDLARWRSLNTGPSTRLPKRDKSVLSPAAVHQARWIHCTLLPQSSSCGMPSRPTAGQDHPADGLVALNCLQELKIRPARTVLNGQNWAAGHALATRSDLQQQPYVQLSYNCKILILICR